MRSILNLLSFVIIVLLIVSIAGKMLKKKKPIKKKLEALGACLIVFVILGVVMPSRSPESVENGLETETTKNEIEQSIAVETETQKNTKCNCFNFKSFAKRGCRTLVRQPLTFTSHIVRSLDSHYHSSKLLTDFFIRNKSREAVLIISKIS